MTSPTPDPKENMTLEEAVQRMNDGTLPEPPLLSAADVVRDALEMDRANIYACKLRPEAKELLERVLKWLTRLEQQGKA